MRNPGLAARFATIVHGGVERIVRAASWLALPLSLLLFLQWPLREIVQAYSREANDLAQILFALYVSVAVTAATRSNEHLAADAFAHRYGVRTRRRLARIAALCVALPWTVFLLVTATAMIAQSVMQAENFPETYNPGYFMIKVAVGVLGLLVGIQALLDATHHR